MTISIHDSTRPATCLAQSLVQGDCFRYQGKIYQMADERTRCAGVADECRFRLVNSLEDGYRTEIPFDAIVEPVHLEVSVCRPRDE